MSIFIYIIDHELITDHKKFVFTKNRIRDITLNELISTKN